LQSYVERKEHFTHEATKVQRSNERAALPSPAWRALSFGTVEQNLANNVRDELGTFCAFAQVLQDYQLAQQHAKPF
jgi:hypothetical protein